MRAANFFVWVGNNPRAVLAVVATIVLLGLWWFGTSKSGTHKETQVSERVVGDSIALDSSDVWVTDLSPWFSSGKVQTTDSTGEQRNVYRIPTSRSNEDRTTETVRIENGGEVTELLVQPPAETRLFPHFRSSQNYVTVLKGNGVSITRTHRSFVDFHFAPTIGVAFEPSASLSVGATALRIGPVLFGGSLLVSKDRLSVSGDASIDVATRLNLSVGVSHRKAVNVGLRYRF